MGRLDRINHTNPLILLGIQNQVDVLVILQKSGFFKYMINGLQRKGVITLSPDFERKNVFHIPEFTRTYVPGSEEPAHLVHNMAMASYLKNFWGNKAMILGGNSKDTPPNYPPGQSSYDIVVQSQYHQENDVHHYGHRGGKPLKILLDFKTRLAHRPASEPYRVITYSLEDEERAIRSSVKAWVSQFYPLLRRKFQGDGEALHRLDWMVEDYEKNPTHAGHWLNLTSFLFSRQGGGTYGAPPLFVSGGIPLVGLDPRSLPDIGKSVNKMDFLREYLSQPRFRQMPLLEVQKEALKDPLIREKISPLPLHLDSKDQRDLNEIPQEELMDQKGWKPPLPSYSQDSLQKKYLEQRSTPLPSPLDKEKVHGNHTYYLDNSSGEDGSSRMDEFAKLAYPMVTKEKIPGEGNYPGHILPKGRIMEE